MEQLALSFGEHISYKLKKTNWDFSFKPDQFKKTNPNDKFIKLDRSDSHDKKQPPQQNKIIKIEF